jgi:hypothetical protein
MTLIKAVKEFKDNEVKNKEKASGVIESPEIKEELPEPPEDSKILPGTSGQAVS